MNAYENKIVPFAETLINTYDTFLEEPEHLRTPADLNTFLQQHELAVNAMPSVAELAAVRSLREELREIWTASELPDAVERLNNLVAVIRATPRVECDGDGVILSFVAERQAPLADRLTLMGVLDLVNLLQSHGHSRMRFCASSPCRDVFVDTSRNRTRRFCSERCANRHNVAAYRERQRSDGD